MMSLAEKISSIFKFEASPGPRIRVEITRPEYRNQDSISFNFNDEIEAWTSEVLRIRPED